MFRQPFPSGRFQACRIYEMAAQQDTEMDDVDDAEFDQFRIMRLNEEEGLDEK